MSAKIRIIVIEGDSDSLHETARALAEDGVWDSTIAGLDVLPERLLGPPDRDIALKNALAIAEPFIERERAERDWKQRERQRPKRRRR